MMSLMISVRDMLGLLAGICSVSEGPWMGSAKPEGSRHRGGPDHKLAALLQAGDEHRFRRSAREKAPDRSCVAGRAGADDEDGAA